MSTEAEKREYYRIDDQVLVHCALAADEPDSELTEEADTPELQQMRAASEELSTLINAINNEHKAVAQALGLINRKQQLLEKLVLGSQKTGPEYALVTANISGAGISYVSANQFEPDETVRVSLMLQPSQLEVSLLGTVLECPETNGGYQLRVDFDKDEAARELIVQHVVQRHS